MVDSGDFQGMSTQRSERQIIIKKIGGLLGLLFVLLLS